MRPLHWFVIALLLTATAAPPLSAQSQPAAGRDQVVVGMVQEPDSLNPMFRGAAAEFAVLPTVFTTDVQRDETGKLFPQGVEYLPSVRDGTWKLDGDRMTLVWKIKPRNWHDGTPVTCGDYVFSHAVARNEQVPGGAPGVRRDFTKRIANVVCAKGADSTEVTVNWKERYAHANTAITEHGALPRHVLEPFYRRNPSTLNQAPYGNDPKVTVGDGAYRLVEWRKGTSLTVESIGDHPVLGTPKIKRITWRFLDSNALVANMLSGAIDVISAIGATFDQAIQLERQAGGRFKVYWHVGEVWEHIDFNLDNPLLQDVRVRRAIAHGINREQLVQQLFQGRQPVSHTYLPPKHPGYTDKVQKYPYDPARARAILADAGFTPGPDGIMRNAAGQRLALEINTTTGSTIREQVEHTIQQHLRQVGIELTTLNFPPRVLFAEITGRRKFKALAMYAWVLSPTSGCEDFYASDRIPSEASGWAGSNYPGYKNAEMDRACKEADREIDETRRNTLLNNTARILSRDLPALPLYYRAQAAVAKIGLQNFTIDNFSGSTYETWNAHKWSWK